MTAPVPEPQDPARPRRSPGRSSSVQVGALSLAQLHQAAQRGSRRAKAELARRMAEDDPTSAAAAPAVRSPQAVPDAQPAFASVPAMASAPVPASKARPQPAAVSASSAMAAQKAAASAPAEPGADKQALVEQWAQIERQELERTRRQGASQLIGMLLLGWGVLVGLGGLIFVAYGPRASDGLYYLLCGVGAAAVGGLLMRNKRWALFLHPALLVVALGVAWGQGGTLSAVAQASPLLLPVLWVLMPSVRDALD